MLLMSILLFKNKTKQNFLLWEISNIHNQNSIMKPHLSDTWPILRNGFSILCKFGFDLPKKELLSSFF